MSARIIQQTPANTNQLLPFNKKDTPGQRREKKMSHAFSFDVQEAVFLETFCPAQIRRTVEALIIMFRDGEPDAEDKAKYSDWWLGSRLLGYEGLEKSEDALRAAGKRARTALIEWQTEHKITFAVFYVGGLEVESKVFLPVLDLIVNVKDALAHKRYGKARLAQEIRAAVKNNLHLIADRTCRVDLVNRRSAHFDQRRTNRALQPVITTQKFVSKMLGKGINPQALVRDVLENHPQRLSVAKSEDEPKAPVAEPAQNPPNYGCNVQSNEEVFTVPQETVNVKLLIDNELIEDDDTTAEIVKTILANHRAAVKMKPTDAMFAICAPEIVAEAIAKTAVAIVNQSLGSNPAENVYNMNSIIDISFVSNSDKSQDFSIDSSKACSKPDGLPVADIGDSAPSREPVDETHNSELCGCESDAEFCPANPQSMYYLKKDALQNPLENSAAVMLADVAPRTFEREFFNEDWLNDPADVPPMMSNHANRHDVETVQPHCPDCQNHIFKYWEEWQEFAGKWFAAYDSDDMAKVWNLAQSWIGSSIRPITLALLLRAKKESGVRPVVSPNGVV